MRRPLLSAAVMLVAATPLFAQVPVPQATDIYLAPIRLMPAAPAMGPARVASENPGGYDNQPAFGADKGMLRRVRRVSRRTRAYTALAQRSIDGHEGVRRERDQP